MGKISIIDVVKEGYRTFFFNLSRYGLLIGSFWLVIFSAVLLLELVLTGMFNPQPWYDQYQRLEVVLQKMQWDAYGKLAIQSLTLPFIAGLFARRTFLIRGSAISDNYPFSQLLGLSVIMALISVLMILVGMIVPARSIETIVFQTLFILPFNLFWIGIALLSCSALTSSGSTLLAALKLSFKVATQNSLSVMLLTLMASLASVSGVFALGIGALITAPLIFVIFPIYWDRVVGPKNRNISTSLITENNAVPSESEDLSYYARALKELDANGPRESGAWAKALVMADGSEAIAKAKYIEIRAKYLLQEDTNRRISAEKALITDKQEKENKRIKSIISGNYTVEEYSEEKGIPQEKIIALIRAGNLKGNRDKGYWVITDQALVKADVDKTNIARKKTTIISWSWVAWLVFLSLIAVWLITYDI